MHGVLPDASVRSSVKNVSCAIMRLTMDMNATSANALLETRKRSERNQFRSEDVRLLNPRIPEALANGDRVGARAVQGGMPQVRGSHQKAAQ